MGQTPSSSSSTAGSLNRQSGSHLVGLDPAWDDFLHDQIRKHSQTLRLLTLLTYDDLLDKICQLNAISSKYVDCKGKQLLFEIKPGSDGNVLWKGTVRIKVMKIDPEQSDVIEKTRELNLKQFLQLYNTLEMMMDVDKPGGNESGTPRRLPKSLDFSEKDAAASCSSSSDGKTCGEDEEGEDDCGGCAAAGVTDGEIGGGEKARRRKSSSDRGAAAASGGRRSSGSGKSRLIPPIMDTSIILDNLDSKFGEECCICMENRPEVSLPCAHSYCLPCIEQWNVDHKTCPICREKLETTDDTWVLEDRPDPQQVDQEIQKSLFDLF